VFKSWKDYPIGQKNLVKVLPIESPLCFAETVGTEVKISEDKKAAGNKKLNEKFETWLGKNVPGYVNFGEFVALMIKGLGHLITM
jgi:hypothetical protein